MTLSPELVHQFRVVAIERIERVEAAWAHVLAGLDDSAAALVHREVHTLKAESRVVGFADVNLVCHKLEDLLEIARSRGYAIDEEFDLVVHMALRFMATLITKQPGARGGVDLPGFVRQIDAILKRHDRTRSRTGSVPPALRAGATARTGSQLRDQLAPAAVNLFIEYAVARGARRDRLRASWHLLRNLIGFQRAVISAAQLAKYQPSVMTLARELGKQVEVHFDVETSEVPSEVFAAIDLAALHLVRNAVDHGIEPEAARVVAGKRPVGVIRLSGRLRDGQFVLAVDDDGAGIDFPLVRAKAVELGLLPETAAVTQDRLVDLMCHPGFSTRSEPSEVSGRGVGLDAVRGSAVDLGGAVTARSVPGAGTTWTVAIPVPPLTVHGLVIRAPGLRFPVVIEPGWRLLERPREPAMVDLGLALGLAPSNSISTSMWSFSDDEHEVGLLCGGRPCEVQARRLVPTRASALAEVVTVDSVEGLLVRPGRIRGVIPDSLTSND